MLEYILFHLLYLPSSPEFSLPTKAVSKGDIALSNDEEISNKSSGTTNDSLLGNLFLLTYTNLLKN